MPDGIFDFSPRGWGRVILGTVVGTIGRIAAALYVDSFNFPTFDREQLMRAVLIDIFLPIVLAVPIIGFLSQSCASWRLRITGSSRSSRPTA